MGGFKEMSHPPLPLVMIRVKVAVGLIFRFMGGVGGWFQGNVPPTLPLGYG